MEENDERFGFEVYEISGASKIQHVLKEQREVDVNFRAACRLWAKFSDEEYCAGWMSMESFESADDSGGRFANLDAAILYAYDTYGKN